MNTTVSKSFGLALLLAVGIIAVMVAMGAFTSQRAAANVSEASISADPNITGKKAAITIVLTESEDLPKGGTISLTFPVDTDTILPSTATATIEGTAGTAATTAGGTARAMGTVTGNNTNHILAVTIGDITDADNTPNLKFKGGKPITIVIAAGVTKLPKEGMHEITIGTNAGSSKSGTAKLDVRGGTLTVNPTGAGAAAAATVSFTETATAGDVDPGDTISIKLKDFGVPSTIPASSVLIKGDGTGKDSENKDAGIVSKTAEGVSVSVDTISITIPDMVEGGSDNGLEDSKLITVLIRQSAGITLPTAAGDYPAVITVTRGAVEGADKATNDIPIVRALSLSPSSGAKGTSVTASGKGWGSTGPVMLWINDGAGTIDKVGADNNLRDGLEVILAENVAVSGGAFSATFTADTGFGGTTTIQARDAAGNYLTDVAGREFKVTGSLSLDKDSVKVNETLEITLSDYEEGDVTEVTIGGEDQMATIDGDEEVSADGDAVFTIQVDSKTPLGTQVVSVTAGDDPETKTATIAVVAVPMTVSPATAALGQEVTVSATGFNAEVTIKTVRVGGATLKDDSNNDPITSDTRKTDKNGNITISIVVPDNAGTGERLIRITDNLERVGEARITIPSPTLTLSASESRRSSRVTATGTGFVANDSILLNYDTGTRDRSVATATTNSVGEWSVQFVVPADAKIGATHTVTADSSAKDVDTRDPIATKTAKHKVPGATITLDPATAASGETIKITGSSFRGYSAVDILSIGGIGLSTVGIQTNAEGFFSANVTVPQLAPGTHNVLVDIGDEGISEQLVIPVDTTQTVEDVFFDLIANESLQTIWRYDFDTRTWTSYTTDPETSFANDLFEVESSDILNINVSSEQTFSHQKGSSLFEGWNLITLN